MASACGALASLSGLRALNALFAMRPQANGALIWGGTGGIRISAPLPPPTCPHSGMDLTLNFLCCLSEKFSATHLSTISPSTNDDSHDSPYWVILTVSVLTVLPRCQALPGAHHRGPQVGARAITILEMRS